MYFIWSLCVLAQSCLTFYDPKYSSPPSSSVHGSFQARILEWDAFLSPGDLLNPGTERTSPMCPALAGGLFTTEPGLTISLTNNFSIFRQVVWEPCLGPVQVKDGPGVVDWVIVSHRRAQEFLECSDPMSATFHSSWQFSYQRTVEDVESTLELESWCSLPFPRPWIAWVLWKVTILHRERLGACSASRSVTYTETRTGRPPGDVLLPLAPSWGLQWWAWSPGWQWRAEHLLGKMVLTGDWVSKLQAWGSLCLGKCGYPSSAHLDTVSQHGLSISPGNLDQKALPRPQFFFYTSPQRLLRKRAGWGAGGEVGVAANGKPAQCLQLGKGSPICFTSPVCSSSTSLSMSHSFAFQYKEGGFPGGSSGKEPTCQCRRHSRHIFDPWVGKIPQRRSWQPTPVFLPGQFRGQKSLVGYSSWGLQSRTWLKRLSVHGRKDGEEEKEWPCRSLMSPLSTQGYEDTVEGYQGRESHDLGSSSSFSSSSLITTDKQPH